MVIFFVCMQVTFEQHKENLSHMFRQYQRHESAGSLRTIRTVSGASQSSETTECVNGPPAEEAAPSTVIELTVDEQPDSASSSTITSSPLEAADERGQASITVSNILARAEEDDQKQVQESSTDGTEATGMQETSKDGPSDEPNKQEPMTENNDNLQTSVSDLPETKAAEVVRDSAKTSASDDMQTPATDDAKSVSEHNKGESANSMTDDSLKGADTELPVISDQESKNDQMSTESTACLENSVLGGTSFVKEDLVNVSSVSDQILPSEADDSQEESSYASATAGDEVEVVEKEGDKQDEDDEGKKNEGQECKEEEEKDEKQEVTIEGKAEESEEQASGLESQKVETTPTAAPEENVIEPPKEIVKDGQSSSITETASADQQPADTPPSTDQEVAAASDSAAAPPSQPSETACTTGEETLTSAPDSSAATSSSDTQKSADSKTKEIKIARLDVSNVALDTERLELKETFSTVRLSLINSSNFILMYYIL